MYAPAEKLRNRDKEAENVNHKHLLRGREAEHVNALKLQQKAFPITFFLFLMASISTYLMDSIIVSNLTTRVAYPAFNTTDFRVEF